MIAISMAHRQRADLRALITASANELGRYQLTWMDDGGPSGHTCRDTPEAAVLYALEESYRLVTAEPAEALEIAERAQARHDARRDEIDAWILEADRA